MVRKSVSTIFGLCCAVLVLVNSPTVEADGHEDGKAKLPEVFKLSNRGEGMSDELVFKLQTVTAVNRLQAAAQTDEELNALKYEDTMAALEAVGVEWSGDTEVAITRDENASEDVVTISRNGGSAVLRYDDEGNQIDNEQEMGTRGYFTQETLDMAILCCWTDNGKYVGKCDRIYSPRSPNGDAPCAVGRETCHSEWIPGGVLQCAASY